MKAINRVSVISKLFVMLIMGLLAPGCGGRSGPPLTNVTGTVKLDGSPLSGAQVTFQPVSGKRPSFGITDSNGFYKLKFNQTAIGSEEGEHVVRISTFAPPVDNGKITTEGEPEKVPAAYNDKAQDTPKMKVEVKGRATTVNFDLDSKVGPLPARPKLRVAKK